MYQLLAGMEGKITADDQAWIYANGRHLPGDNGKWRTATR